MKREKIYSPAHKLRLNLLMSLASLSSRHLKKVTLVLHTYTQKQEQHGNSNYIRTIHHWDLEVCIIQVKE